MRQFHRIFWILLVFLISCRCAEYDDNTCDYCDLPKICNNGFCECDTSNYYNFAGYCDKKGIVTYRNMANFTGCLSDQIVIDSLDFDGTFITYGLQFKVDSVFIEEDRLVGRIFYNPDGDSLALQTTFNNKKINGTICNGYYYCKNRENELFVNLIYRDINDFNNIQDSCSFKLYRDK